MFKGIPLRNLKHFIYSFDFLKMPEYELSDERDSAPNPLPGHQPAGRAVRTLSSPQRNRKIPRILCCDAGKLRGNRGAGFARRFYQADWIDPASGSSPGSVKFAHQGGNKTLITPQHEIDIALRIKRVQETEAR